MKLASRPACVLMAALSSCGGEAGRSPLADGVLEVGGGSMPGAISAPAPRTGYGGPTSAAPAPAGDGQVAGSGGGSGMAGSTSMPAEVGSSEPAGFTDAGAGEDGGVAADAGAPGCDEAFPLLVQRCGGAACHGGSSGGALSNFTASPEAARSFVGQPVALCEGIDEAPLFDRDDPAASLLLKKILGTSACGGRMPLGAVAPVYRPEELACLELWISTL